MASKAVNGRNKAILGDFLRAYLIPTLIGMGLILYLGSNYARYPGTGYGIGLLFAVVFTLGTLGTFLWRYRDYEDI